MFFSSSPVLSEDVVFPRVRHWAFRETVGYPQAGVYHASGDVPSEHYLSVGRFSIPFFHVALVGPNEP